MFRVRVPASASNLGPGFDCLGLAVDLVLEAEAEFTGHELVIEELGPDGVSISHDATNLVHACLSRVLRRAGHTPAGLRLRIQSDIPIGRGLGSSAAATVAGLALGYLLTTDMEPDRHVLLTEATAIEGHPDNAAAAIYGGLVASIADDDAVGCCPLLFPSELAILLVIPEREVPTAAARALLPDRVSRADAVFNLQHLAQLIGAFATRQTTELRSALRDRLHQEHRLRLVPGLPEALAALDEEPGILGAVLSGSGPTLLGFLDGPRGSIGQRAVAALERAGVDATVRQVRVSPRGATWERDPAPLGALSQST